MSVLSIHQPQYLPYLGFYHKLMSSDVFVYLDNVQFINNGFIHRNRIKTTQGAAWINVPIEYKFKDRINQINISQDNTWVKRTLKTIELNYKTAYFGEYYDELQEIYEKNHKLLVDLDIDLIDWTIRKLDIKIPYIRSSDFELNIEPTQRLVDLCYKLNCDTYLSGSGGKNYLDVKKFEAAGIKLLFQDFRHPKYKQRYLGFIENLSIIDLLFNEGSNSKKIIGGTKNV